LVCKTHKHEAIFMILVGELQTQIRVPNGNVIMTFSNKLLNYYFFK
jgi:hypothetical protein